jgi:hypothetical protein
MFMNLGRRFESGTILIKDDVLILLPGIIREFTIYSNVNNNKPVSPAVSIAKPEPCGLNP